MLPQVIKRDGQKEEFSVINLAKVVVAAGLTPDQAKDVAEKIRSWVMSLGVTEVSSLQIRDQLLAELLLVNEHAAELYRWYEQTKES